MSNFKLPPISTLSGTTLINFIRIIKHEHIAPKYYFKIFLSILIILIATPFHIWEKLYFSGKVKRISFSKPPVFIIGHWRSGTTFLHNMLCKDPDAAYMTTYQSVFPNNMASKWLFRTFMRVNMPDKRPSDNVKLNIDYPQEDEFAFCNVSPYSYYKFFYFPSSYKTIYRNAIYHENLTPTQIEKWYRDYDNLLKKAMLNTNGKRLIMKNPVNTARINNILKLYPDAKILYIYRNPITVFLSTERFFKSLFPTLQLQNVDDEFIDKMIFDIYQKLMDDYLAQKSLIPEGNLFELRFEDFELNPLEQLQKIYNSLLCEDFSRVKDYFVKYFDSQKSYKKNRYKIKREKIDLIRTRFAKYMELYNYDIPDDIEII